MARLSRCLWALWDVVVSVGYWLPRQAAINISYWIRPYDMLADARRWRWQKRQPCGLEVWHSMSAEDRAQILGALERLGWKRETVTHEGAPDGR